VQCYCDVCTGVNRQIALYAGDKGQCSRLSTGGVDGQLVIWDLKVTSFIPSLHLHCKSSVEFCLKDVVA